MRVAFCQQEVQRALQELQQLMNALGLPIDIQWTFPGESDFRWCLTGVAPLDGITTRSGPK
ncbi:MAG: hypothetical protein L0215_23035 [Gemmataceae bacterium]|nr:hypothetical protein [Gemmataceae bacterium]